MIIARGEGPGKGQQMILLGLSRINIERLTAGKPIWIRRQTHGEGVPEGWSISIVFGETEEAIRQAMEQAGAIGPDTQVRIDPRLERG